MVIVAHVEVKYELIPRLDVVGAYRYNDVKTTIGKRLMRAALQSRYKGLLNLSYYTNMRKWQFSVLLLSFPHTLRHWPT